MENNRIVYFPLKEIINLKIIIDYEKFKSKINSH